MKLAERPSIKKELKLGNLVMSGEAARICEVDRRTFFKRAKKANIKPVDYIEGKAVYRRADIEKLAKIIHAQVEKR